MPWVFMVILAFLSGSIPFSVWLGRLLLKRDVRQVGDGNPGAANVFRAGGRAVGLLVLLLDVAKAALPVGLAYNIFSIRGIPMVLIGLAPMLGHAFSPFLGFRGGKAIATTLGVWIGLTIWKASLAGVIAVVIGIAVTTSSALAVACGMAAILMTLLVWLPDPLFLAVWAGQLLTLAWKHRVELRQHPRLRPWLMNLLRARSK